MLPELKEFKFTLENIEDIQDNYIELFNDFENQTEFQNEFFVLDFNGLTLYGKYRQALREFLKRHRGLRDSIYKQNKTKIELEKLERLLKEIKDPLDIKDIKNEIEHQKLIIKENDRALKGLNKEFQFFLKKCIEFKKELGDLSDYEKLNHEIHFWKEKFKLNARMDYMVHGSVNKGVLESILSLPENVREDLISELIELKEKDLLQLENKETNNGIIPK